MSCLIKRDDIENEPEKQSTDKMVKKEKKKIVTQENFNLLSTKIFSPNPENKLVCIAKNQL